MDQVPPSSLTSSSTVYSRLPARATAASPVWRRIIKYRTMYLFLLPAIAFVMVFSYRPMIGVIMAFQKYDIVAGMFHSPFVGLDNFRAFLADADFYRGLRNTVAINGLHILIGFPLPIALAIVIFDMRDTLYKRVTQTISYLPHFVSWVAIAGIVYKLLDYHEGIINILLTAFRSEAVPFMRSPEYFWWIAVLVTVWKDIGWNTIIYLAALSGIPPEQYEAAIVDGANWFQQLLYITLPSIAPTVALMLIFTVGSLVSQSSAIGFDAIYNLRNAMVSSNADTLDYYVYVQGVVRTRYGFATAVGLVQGLVSLLLVMGSNAISRHLRGYGAF